MLHEHTLPVDASVVTFSRTTARYKVTAVPIVPSSKANKKIAGTI
jgi:hypothetical protein